MAITSIQLRKLLKLMYLEKRLLVSALRADIREEIARNSGEFGGGGGDFYGPFWFDAKAHVFEEKDLHEAVEERIAANASRARLYPLLRDGFLLWWNERRRWTNRPFRRSDWTKAQLELPDLNTVVKIDNIMSVRDSREYDHYVYPYFAPDPALRDEAARLGLWAISRATPKIDISSFRILDVIRGQTFSTDRNTLHGDEEHVFRRKYGELHAEWISLRREYDQP